MKNKLSNRYTVILSMIIATAFSACTKDQDFGKLKDEGIAQSVSGTSSTGNPSTGGCTGAGCPPVCPGDPSCPPGVNSGSDSFTISASNNNLDLLFVIDNSGSMDDNQQKLKDSFNTFITSLNNLLNFRIGVISTSIRGNTAFADYFYNGTEPTPYINPTLGRLLHRTNDLFLTNNTPDLVGAFSGHCTQILQKPYASSSAKYFGVASNFCTENNTSVTGSLGNALLGSTGAGHEQGMLAVMKFLSGPDRNTFLRANAKFGIIFLTDENEAIHYDSVESVNDIPANSTGATQAQLRTCNENAITGRINRFKSELGSLNYTIKMFLDTDATAPNISNGALIPGTNVRGYDYCSNPSGNNATCSGSPCNLMYYPEVYRRLASDQGITPGNINDTNFGTSMANFANELISETLAETTLTHIPTSVNSITVTKTVNGVTTTVPKNNTNGWSYNSSTNKIRLNGTSIENNAVINITYTY